MKVEVDLFQSLKLFFDDVCSDYSCIDVEALTLSKSVEQPDWDDDGGNKCIRKRKRSAVETTYNEIHLDLEGKVKLRVEILNVICENLIVQLEKRRSWDTNLTYSKELLLMNITILRKVTIFPTKPIFKWHRWKTVIWWTAARPLFCE